MVVVAQLGCFETRFNREIESNQTKQLTLSTSLWIIVDTVNQCSICMHPNAASVVYTASSFPKRLLTRLALACSLVPFLGACAISTPFPKLAEPDPVRAQEKVVLVLTRIVVDTRQRSEFDRQTRRVIDSMPSHPGLIGYSARRQLFGSEGWTMSVWASDADRANFVRSVVHKEAIAKSQSAIQTVELKRLNVARKDLPDSWPRALEILAQPGDLRNYGE